MRFRLWLEAADSVDVVHETGYHRDAEILLTQGIEPSFKRKVSVDQYAPGLGIDREGLYVNYDRPELGGYGFIRLFLRVPKSQLKVSPELSQNGIDDVEYALNSHDGAVTVGSFPPNVFYRVEVHGKALSPDDYLSSRGLQNIQKLPTVGEYESWLNQHADELNLQPRHIQSILSDYERSDIRGKQAHAEEMR